ncbi:uncharacterized protein LOC111029440 [Myzus persicae]|uniref:uncharacterized protein LOC111029440 n=1 Tax=Myzus persicae TaxID=13164 RepID=UPI000B934D98|nr:uncharacterized protein LOC111029440 [Myzus persicae]
MHSNADYHKLSTLRADEFVIIIINKKFDVATQVDYFKKAQVIENRLKLIPTIETIIFCGRQELAVRGHNDSGPIFNCEKDNNDCDFRALLRYRALRNETCDISCVEQMSLCISYIDNGFIREDFLEFVPIYDASGKGMACTVIREMGKLGLKIENLIGQGYDGASAMSGLY